MEYRISVLIRTYNEQKHLGQVLESLSKQTYRNFEVIILDSGSTDDTLKIARRFDVRIEHIPKSDFSYSYASNLLVEFARGDIVCFLSGHAVPIRNTYLSEINAVFQNSEVGGCYGKVLALPDGSITEKLFYRISYLRCRLQVRNRPFLAERTIHPGIFNCCNASARRELLLKHPFAPELGNGGEDTEAAYRIIQDGYVIACIPRLLVMHSHSLKLPAFIRQYRRWQAMWADVQAHIRKTE